MQSRQHGAKVFLCVCVCDFMTLDIPWLCRVFIARRGVRFLLTHGETLDIWKNWSSVCEGEIPSLFLSCVLKLCRWLCDIFHQFTVSTAAPRGFCCLCCGRDIITTSPPLMIVYHQRKAINTNIAMLTNTLLSTDLIAALPGCSFT